jgi:hypothetical protein
MGQKAKEKMQVCKFFQTKNGCWYGEKCEYMHVAKETIYKGRICKFYLGGSCNKGDNCSFRHPTDVRKLTEKKDGSNYERRSTEVAPERNTAHSRILQQNREAKKADEKWISPKQEYSKWDEDDVDEEDLPDERWDEYPELAVDEYQYEDYEGEDEEEKKEVSEAATKHVKIRSKLGTKAYPWKKEEKTFEDAPWYNGHGKPFSTFPSGDKPEAYRGANRTRWVPTLRRGKEKATEEKDQEEDKKSTISISDIGEGEHPEETSYRTSYEHSENTQRYGLKRKEADEHSKYVKSTHKFDKIARSNADRSTQVPARSSAWYGDL